MNSTDLKDYGCKGFSTVFRINLFLLQFNLYVLNNKKVYYQLDVKNYKEISSTTLEYSC